MSRGVSELLPLAESVRTVPYQRGTIPLFPFDRDNFRAFDQYRIIRTKIVQHLALPRQIAITSAAPKDGKTITSLNTAGVMALKGDTRVMLVEADLHRGNIAGLLGIPPKPGLSDVLRGRCRFEDAIVRIEQIPNLYVLVAGDTESGATELLDSSAWKNLCQTLNDHFSYTIFDSPPWGMLADADLITAHADGLIFVVRPDHSNRTLALRALNDVPKDKLIGVILNSAVDWALHRPGYSYYGGYYGYYGYYGYGKKKGQSGPIPPEPTASLPA